MRALPDANAVVGMMLLTGTAVVYAAAFLFIGPLLGSPVMALLLVPALLAGWYFGALGGGVAAVVFVALNAALGEVAAPNPELLRAAAFPGAIPGGLAVLACGIAVGSFRERHLVLIDTERAVRDKLHESEALALALRASERRFRLLTEEALVGVYLIQDEAFRYVNAAFSHTFGYETDEIIDHLGPAELTWPEDRPLVRAELDNRLVRGAGSAHYRFRGLHKDGRSVPVEALGRSLQIDGEPAILGTLLDLSRQTQDEATLRMRLTALEAASAGIVVADPSGVIEWANPHALALSGYSLDEVMGQHTRLFNSGHQSSEFYRQLWATISSGQVWRGELINRRKDGSEYPEEMSITPVQGGNGSIEHFVAVKQDVTERRAAEKRIRALNASLEEQLARITTLHNIDVAIADGRGLEGAMQVLLEASRTGLGVDATCAFLAAPDGKCLELVGTAGYRSPLARFRIPFGEGVAGRAVADGAPVVVHGRENVLQALVLEEDSTLPAEQFETFVAAPMTVRGEMRGALVAAQRAHFATSDHWLEYFSGVATQGAILVDNATLLSDLKASNAELRAAYDATIEGWSRALDLRDKETEGHSRRVTDITLRLARVMGLSEEKLVHVRRGALLHDIGKMGVPDSILQKPGPLTDEEWAIMRQHTVFARDLLAPIAFLGPALEIPFSHHERWDGSGYPEGLEGDAIPLAARIFAIADVYDALTSDRPYRKAWTREKALEHIHGGRGSHFDPAVVDTFLAHEWGRAEGR